MNALQVSNLGSVTLSITPEAEQLKHSALEKSRAISVVRDAEGQEIAVRSLQATKGLLKQLESNREEVKAPVLAIGRKIDATAKQFAEELQAEAARVNGLINAFQIEERRQAAEAEKMRQDMLRREREKAERAEREAAERQRRLDAEAAKAKSAEDADRIAKQRQEEQDRQQALRAAMDEKIDRMAAAPAPAVAKAPSMTVRREWKAAVVDLPKLYAARPELCRVEANLAAINAELRGGMRECPGLHIFEETTTGVRVS